MFLGPKGFLAGFFGLTTSGVTSSSSSLETFTTCGFVLGNGFGVGKSGNSDVSKSSELDAGRTIRFVFFVFAISGVSGENGEGTFKAGVNKRNDFEPFGVGETEATFCGDVLTTFTGV